MLKSLQTLLPDMDAFSPHGENDKPSMFGHLCFMEHWKDLSLTNIVEEFEGIVYTERWMPIVGYETKYHISDFGRVKSLKYGRQKDGGERILKQGLCAGYPRVDLVVKTNHKLVHIMTARAFIPNPEKKPQVNHKWGVKTDNRFHQLEWSNSSEQQLHAIRVLGHVPKNPPPGIRGGNNPSARAIKKIDTKSGEVLFHYLCIMDAERDTGIPNSRIVSAAKGKYHTAGGFKWEYA